MIETAYAKLNLALHVRAREADGYHRIETRFAFCVDGDTLALAGDAPLTIDGPFAAGLSAGPDNLVRRAADAMAARYGVRPPRLTLTKRLPVASGIGGGSADAAATLRLLARHAGIAADDPGLSAIAATLGSDVPACLASRSAIGSGRGDRLVPVHDGAFAGCPVLLVNPRVPLSTAAVFAGWDRADRGALGPDPACWRNDLERPARALAPAIGHVLATLAECAGVRLVRMSGSGATCFALFQDDTARDAAGRAVARTASDWWQMATRLVT